MKVFQGLVVLLVLFSGVNHKCSIDITMHLDVLQAHVQNNDIISQKQVITVHRGFKAVIFPTLDNRGVGEVIGFRQDVQFLF